MALFIILIVIAQVAIPVLVIFVIIKLLQRLFGHSGSQVRPPITDRELVLGFLGTNAALAGVISLYWLPDYISPDLDNGWDFGIRVVAAVVALLIGLMIGGVAGKVLMGTGLALLAILVPFVLTTVGESAALVMALLAFAALVLATLKLTQKGGAA